MDNIFIVIMDVLRMMGVSSECIGHLKTLFLNSWMMLYPDNTPEKGDVSQIHIKDKGWNENVLK